MVSQRISEMNWLKMEFVSPRIFTFIAGKVSAKISKIHGSTEWFFFRKDRF